MNEAAREVKSEKPTEPKEDENNCDDCEHAIDSAFLLWTVAYKEREHVTGALADFLREFAPNNQARWGLASLGTSIGRLFQATARARSK